MLFVSFIIADHERIAVNPRGREFYFKVRAMLFETKPVDTAPVIGTISPWFGSNRMLAPVVAQEVGCVDWCGIPFAGGMSEALVIKSRSFLIGDLHRDIINCAKVLRVPELRQRLAVEADAKLFHPDELIEAQAICKASEAAIGPPGLERALNYFVASWMGRSATAGTDSEFDGALAVRYTASGGGSNVRYRSAIRSIEAFGKVCELCEFTVADFREFFKKCHDRDGHAIYIDAPFPEKGGGYRHKFSESDQKDLANLAGQFSKTRVVIRFYDHPLIRSLYPESYWTWRFLSGRDQANNAKKKEVLLINGKSYA